MTMTNKSWAVILLAVWMLLYGVLAITNITFVAATIVMGVLAILVAICLFVGK